MNKAEERAKERYWLEPCNIDIQNKYHAYIEGYRQAEKDLELTNETVQATCYAFENGEALFTFRLPEGTYLVGSKVKVIIKQE